MAKTINPRFDFRGPTPLVVDLGDFPLGRIPHSPARQPHNSLAPNKFDEYERVCVEIASAIGDYGVSDTIPASADNMGAGLRKLYWIKFDKAGGTLEGPVIFSSLATVVFGADITINADVSHAGSYEITGTSTSTDRDLTVVGHVVARGVKIEWATGTLYRVGDIVVYDKKIYRCKSQHTSSGTFVVDYASRWELAGGGGSTTIDVNVAPLTHTFTVGNILFYQYHAVTCQIGYKLAQANTPYTPALALVVAVPDNQNFTLMTGGYTDSLAGVQAVIEGTGVSENLVQNTWYYLSANYPGRFTRTVPSIAMPVFYTLKNNLVTPKEALVYIGGQGQQGGGAMNVEEFTAGAGQTVFDLTAEPIGKSYLFVFSNGTAIYDTAWDVNGSQVTFGAPLIGGELIRFQYITLLDAEPAAVMSVQNFVAIEDQTVFTLTCTYDPLGKAYIFLSIDGVLQDENAYEIAGKVITLASGVIAGTKVRVACVHNLNVVTPTEMNYIRYIPQTSAPTPATKGMLYFDNGTSKLKCYDGALWKDCW